MQGHLLAMDSHAKRLRPLSRAAHRCGVGSFLSIVPGSIQESASGQIQLPEPPPTEDTHHQQQSAPNRSDHNVLGSSLGTGSHYRSIQEPDFRQSSQASLWEGGDSDAGPDAASDFDFDDLDVAPATGRPPPSLQA